MKNSVFLNRNKMNDGHTQAEVMAAIRRRAYELYEQRGRSNGHALEDWARAEAEITRQEEKPAAA